MSNNTIRILCLRPQLSKKCCLVPYQNRNFLDIQIQISNNEAQTEKVHLALEPNFTFDAVESALFTNYDPFEHADIFGVIHFEPEQFRVITHATLFIREEAKNPMEEIEKPLKGKLEHVISEFHAQWLRIDQSLLIELIQFANKWGIKAMLDLTCAQVADMVKGKSPEQIRHMFGIESDYTPEEEEKIREENKWCEDA